MIDRHDICADKRPFHVNTQYSEGPTCPRVLQVRIDERTPVVISFKGSDSFGSHGTTENQYGSTPTRSDERGNFIPANEPVVVACTFCQPDPFEA